MQVNGVKKSSIEWEWVAVFFVLFYLGMHLLPTAVVAVSTFGGMFIFIVGQFSTIAEEEVFKTQVFILILGGLYAGATFADGTGWLYPLFFFCGALLAMNLLWGIGFFVSYGDGIIAQYRAHYRQ